MVLVSTIRFFDTSININARQHELLRARARRANGPLVSTIAQTRIDEMFKNSSHYVKDLHPVPRESKIEQKLGAELLGLVFDHLHDDLPTIHSVRLVCRTFEKNAWPVFAKTFNERVFHPTPQSFGRLNELTLNVAAAPYVRKLNITTVKDLKMSGLTPKEVIAESFSEEGYRRMWETEGFLRARLSNMLHVALARLDNLETICIIDGQEVARLQKPPGTDSLPQAANGATYRPIKIGSQLYDRKAHRHTLTILKEALKIPSNDEAANFLPKLRTVITTGRMNLPSLPPCRMQLQDGQLVPHEKSRLAQLTRLDLAITDNPCSCKLDHNGSLGDMKSYLPNFLASAPNVQDLTLRFTRSRVTREREESIRNILYGSVGFEIIAQTVHLKNLKSLHLVNLGVDPDASLRLFLLKHHATLTALKFTSVALSVSAWRSFVLWIGEQMDLEFFVLDTNMSPEEELITEERWAKVPSEWNIRREDFVRAASKGTKRRCADGSEVVFQKKVEKK